MSTSLYISKSGMNGLQKDLDIVSNNISNINTIGYKKQNSSFQELLLNDVRPADVPVRPNGRNITINRGMKVTQNSLDMTDGSLISTQKPTDLSIAGNAFFQVRGENNQSYLTRDGAFHMDEDNNLKNDNGDMLSMEEYVPKRYWPKGEMTINQYGDIVINQERVGRINLFTVNNPQMLESAGGNRYVVPRTMEVNIDNKSYIQQGYLENSNVELAESMVDMITTQRAYSLNTKILQSTDEMMQRINEFKQ